MKNVLPNWPVGLFGLLSLMSGCQHKALLSRIEGGLQSKKILDYRSTFDDGQRPAYSALPKSGRILLCRAIWICRHKAILSRVKGGFQS